jgi:hypothetical protein
VFLKAENQCLETSLQTHYLVFLKNIARNNFFYKSSVDANRPNSGATAKEFI